MRVGAGRCRLDHGGKADDIVNADQESGFKRELAAGLGLTSRWFVYRALAVDLRQRLEPGERVAVIVPTSEHGSLAEHKRRDIAPGRAWRSLVMVTDRRLIESVHVGESRAFSLAHVSDVQVRAGHQGIATVRIVADAEAIEIHVITEWPKRRAVSAAGALAAAVRRAASTSLGDH